MVARQLLHARLTKKAGNILQSTIQKVVYRLIEEIIASISRFKGMRVLLPSFHAN
jgi:hypothetical protein